MIEDRRDGASPHLAFWTRLDQPELGDAIALLREHCSLSRAELIQRMWNQSPENDLGVDESLVYRWERGGGGRGRPRPGLRYRQLLGKVCASEVGRMSPMERRHFLQKLAALAGPPLLSGLLAVEPDRLAYAGPADPRLLDGLAALTRSYVQLHNMVSPAAVRSAIKRHFDDLVALSLRPHTPTITARVRTLAAQTAILAGWVSFNLQDLGQAFAYWSTAHDLAQEAGNVSVQAHALGCRSRLYSPIHRGTQMGDASLALALLDRANHLAEEAASPALRSWLLSNRAQQLAVTAQASASYRDLDMAAHLVSLAEPTNDDVLSGWDEVRVNAYRGICAMVLRRPAEVIAITEPVLARTDPARVQRCLQQSDLAAAYAQQGEVDHACTLLREALMVANGAQFPEGIQRALRVRTEYIAESDTRAVRELDEMISAVAPNGTESAEG